MGDCQGGVSAETKQTKKTLDVWEISLPRSGVSHFFAKNVNFYKKSVKKSKNIIKKLKNAIDFFKMWVYNKVSKVLFGVRHLECAK